MVKRSARAQIAKETLVILEQGSYTSPTGRVISIAAELDQARVGSLHYPPEQFKDVLRRRDQLFQQRANRPPTHFAVVNETTLHAANRLLQNGGHSRVLALNFASAKNPGGGFLKGSQAQEESLARASALYGCIAPVRKMYEANRLFPSCLYTDHMIYSPDVPIFRDDEGGLLEEPFRVSFITAPAVNAGAVARNEHQKLTQIEPTMLARIERILALAVVHGHDTLVLGAWGCGVFANNPAQVAHWFGKHLTGEGLYRAAFQTVVFAVLDTSADRATIRPFEKLFGDVG